MFVKKPKYRIGYNHQGMINKLRAICQTECGLTSRGKIVVGVSGGPDSLVLLDVLHALGYPLIVAHLDHQLRREASSEAKVVQQIAEALELPFVIRKTDVNIFASKNRLSIEEAARVVRYQFLFEVADNYQAEAVAVAHHADDQVETMLMHLLRGAGLAGLKGMTYRLLPNPWSAAVALVRPMLGIWREEILTHAREHKLQPLMDSSNWENRYFRNWIRNELIPYLENHNPNTRQLFWQTSEVLRGDFEFLDSCITPLYNQCLIESGAGYIGFDYGLINSQPLGAQRMIFRKGMTWLRPSLRDIGFEAVERMVQFLSHPVPSGQIDIGVGLTMCIESNRIWIKDQNVQLPVEGWPQILTGGQFELSIPGTVKLGDNWVFEIQPVDLTEQVFQSALNNENRFQAWVSLDKIVHPLIIKTRSAGDRIKPIGMSTGSMKLSDLMINEKIPARVRSRWPILYTGKEVLWVPGMKLNHFYRISRETQNVARIRLWQEISRFIISER